MRRGGLLMNHRTGHPLRGQALVEFALIAPLFVMVVSGIIIIGIGIFYQQQITNAAREGARFAAVSSATAQCPVAGSYDPSSPPLSYPTPGGCDRKVDGWPRLTAHARSVIVGMDRSAIQVSACWSGYRLNDATGPIDAPPPGTYDVLGAITSVFVQCSIDGQDPTVASANIRCQSGLPTTDQASSISESPGRIVANTVTVYTCYEWRPPLAGFLLLPETVTLRAVITEAIQRQQ